MISSTFTDTGPPRKRDPFPPVKQEGAKAAGRAACSSLPPNYSTHKRFSPSWRSRFIAALSVELNAWLTSVLAGQAPQSQLATLRGTLLAMQYLRRAQLLTRRRGDVRE